MVAARLSHGSRLLPALLLALVGAAAMMGLQLSHAAVSPLEWPLYDYVAFWSAGRLNLQGNDPYDVEALQLVQRQADPHQVDTLVMWPAPWALTLLMPFAGFAAPTSHLMWLAFEFGLLLLAVVGVWRVNGGAAADVWVAGVLAFTFLPTYLVLVTGQLGIFLLLGLIGFLHFQRRGADLAAGAALALTAIKPQLTFLFWIILLAWTIERRRWKLLAGGILGVAVLLAWPVWQNPALPWDYWHALSARTQTHSHLSPVLGTALRMLFGMQHFWLQFVPMLPGLAWAGWYYARHRAAWSWPERLPALLFASLLTASYGAWPFDLVILLLPLAQRAVQLRGAERGRIGAALVWHAGINLLALVQILFATEYFWFVWLTPLLWMGHAFTAAPRSASAGAAGMPSLLDSVEIPEKQAPEFDCSRAAT